MYSNASILRPTPINVSKKDVMTRITKHFAYLPTRLSSGYITWFKDYYIVEKIYQNRVIHRWTSTYDSQEYLARKLADTL